MDSIKEQFPPQNENDIIYSPSCHSNPMLFFLDSIKH